MGKGKDKEFREPREREENYLVSLSAVATQRTGRELMSQHEDPAIISGKEKRRAVGRNVRY